MRVAALLVVLACSARADGSAVLRGEVTDAEGRPLVGAVVTGWRSVWGLDDDPPDEPSDATAVTDVAGSYRLVVDVMDDESGDAVLVVEAPGYAPRTVWVERRLLEAERWIDVHRLALARRVEPPVKDEQAQRVRVLDADGLPVSGAWVAGGARTDDQGWASVGVTRGTSTIDVEVDLRSARLWVRAPLGAEVRLPRLDSSVSGTAAFEGDLRPWGWVSFVAADVRVTVRNDRSRAFVVPVPAGVQGTLEVHAWRGCCPPHVPSLAAVARLPVVAGAADVKVEMVVGSIDGRVVGPTGLGVDQAVVRARLPDGQTLEVVTDSRGRFRLWNLPPGEIRLEAVDGCGRAEATADVRVWEALLQVR